MRKITALEKIVMADEQAKAGAAEVQPPGLGVPGSTNSPGLVTPPAETASSRVSRPVRFLNTMRSYALRKDYLNAINSAHNLEMADASDAVQKALGELISEMQKLNDDQTAEARDQVKTVLDHATKVVTTSTDPKDLDGLAEIGDAIN